MGMVLVLFTLLNSIYQTLIVLSDIVFYTAGSLLGLTIAGQALSIVMVGLVLLH